MAMALGLKDSATTSAHRISFLAISTPLGLLTSRANAVLAGVVVGHEGAVVNPRHPILEWGCHAQGIEVGVGLDVDDGGAVVGEVLDGYGPNAHPREVGDFNPFEISVQANRLLLR